MAHHDPSSSLTTHLLASLNELQAVQQKTQRDLDAERTRSRQLQEQLDASHETIVQLREELRAKQTAADERSAAPPIERSKHASTQRSPSPNHIVSTHFIKGRRKVGFRDDITIPLSSLRMKAGNWKELHLVYSWEYKAIQFLKNDEALLQQGSTIQLDSKHAQTVYCSASSSTAVILCGSTDTFSIGRVWLEFATTASFDGFLETIDHMNTRAKFKDLDADKFAHVCKSNEAFFVPETVESELEASSYHSGREQISATRISSPGLPTTAPREVMHTRKADSLKSKARASDNSNVTIKIEAGADAQKLKDDVQRLEREIATLERKHQSAKDEAASALELNNGEIDIPYDYKSLEKELENQKSKKGAQITQLSVQIENLTSQTTKVKSESGSAATANVASKRTPAKRKRKF